MFNVINKKKNIVGHHMVSILFRLECIYQMTLEGFYHCFFSLGATRCLQQVCKCVE